MSVAKRHKAPWLHTAPCIMWCKTSSWQGAFSSLPLSRKTGAEYTKKTRLWFTTKCFTRSQKRYCDSTWSFPLESYFPTLSSFKQTRFLRKSGLLSRFSFFSALLHLAMCIYSGRFDLDMRKNTSKKSSTTTYIQFQTSRLKYNIYTGWTKQPQRKDKM